jgi:hypothetical protein
VLVHRLAHQPQVVDESGTTRTQGYAHASIISKSLELNEKKDLSTDQGGPYYYYYFNILNTKKKSGTTWLAGN